MTNAPILAVLVSGNGSNLQSIIDHIEQKKLQAQIGIVISDNEQAFALERSRQANIPAKTILRKDFQSKKNFEDAIVDTLKKANTDWIILAGFMRILSEEFVRNFRDRILNIHPSILPDYPGLNAIESAWKAKDSFTGVTVHFVDEGVDTGPIVLQEKVSIDPADTLDTLTHKVHSLEHQLYPKAIQKVLLGTKA